MSLGNRHNSGKLPLNFILSAPNAVNQLAAIMAAGEAKYDRDNWKKGLVFEELLDSLLRHLVRLSEGEAVDSETGLPHTGHILCNAFFLAELLGEQTAVSNCGKDLSEFAVSDVQLSDALLTFKNTFTKAKAKARSNGTRRAK